MDRYDAEQNPDPIAWLELDEGERIELVLEYHRRLNEKLPAPRLHAAIHVVVENQVATTSPPIVIDTLSRLQQEGLSRHEAIHAIGELVTARLAAAVKPDTADTPEVLNARYETALAELNAEAWRASFS